MTPIGDSRPPSAAGNPPAESRRCSTAEGDEWNAALVSRLQVAAWGHSCEEIGKQTRAHPATVRRYLHGGHVTARFIAAFCRAYGLNTEWLLLGRPPMYVKGRRRTAPARVA